MDYGRYVLIFRRINLYGIELLFKTLIGIRIWLARFDGMFCGCARTLRIGITSSEIVHLLFISMYY